MAKSSNLKMKLCERKEAVLLLRFRTVSPKLDSFKYCSYRWIAQIVNLTIN